MHAQDPLQLLPSNYRLVFENDAVRAIHVTYRPHEKLAVHDHSKTPTIYVYLTASGPVRFSHLEEKAFSLDRKPVEAGRFRVSPGRVEVHTVENLGEITSEFLRIELRQIPLGFQNTSFRDMKPLHFSTSSTSDEFRSPMFHIQRVIAAESRPVSIPELDKPSLIVALSDAELDLQSGKRDKLECGEVRWLAEGQIAGIVRRGSAPAHVLRVVFDRPAKAR